MCIRDRTWSLVEIAYILRVARDDGEPLDVQVHVRVFPGDSGVVGVLLGCATRDVDSRPWMTGPVFGIFADLCNVRPVNASSEVWPEVISDNAIEASDRVLVQARLGDYDTFRAIFNRPLELLQEIGEVVGAPNVVLDMTLGAGCADPEIL